jgi:hypothetical protein
MIHSVSVKESRQLQKRKQLRGLVADMADSLMEAADLLDEEHNGMRSAAKQTQAPEQVPQAGAPAMMDGKKEEEKGSSKIAEFRRSLVRRSA